MISHLDSCIGGGNIIGSFSVSVKAVRRPMSSPNPVFAVFIDGDNISTTRFIEVWKKLKKNLNPRMAKVFFGKNSLDQWEKTAGQHGIHPVWVPSNTGSGKNSVDISLVIDVMEMHYTQKDITHFCIIASDSDYTALATRLKNEGKYVLGIGEKNTPPTLRSACSRFLEFDEIVPPDPDVTQNKPVETIPSVQTKPAPSTANGDNKKPTAASPSVQTKPTPSGNEKKLAPSPAVNTQPNTEPPPKSPFDSLFLRALINAHQSIPASSQTNDGWIQLPALMAEVKKQPTNAQLSSKEVAMMVTSFATVFPKWFEIEEQSDTKPVSHRLRLPQEIGLYMVLAAYVSVVKNPNVESTGGWVKPTSIGQALKDLFPVTPIRYKGSSKLQKVLEEISKDNPGLIPHRVKGSIFEILINRIT